MKFDILNSFTGEVQFSADIEADGNMPRPNRLRLAVFAALRTGADLRGADLRWADLRSANLGGANLRGAHLRSANLRSANLTGANLAWANLTGANLTGANLRSANLGDANLRGADLRGADLDFSSGIPFHCGGTNFVGDDRLFAQMVFHLTRGDWSKCSAPVREAAKHITSLGVANLFCEYRDGVEEI